MQKVIYKLNQIQCGLKAPKGQYNSFGKYAYRSCESILEALKEHLAANSCVLVMSDQVEHIGDRYYIRATAKLIDTESGESVENTALAREEDTKKGMDGSQITGTASSYARKYALNGLFCIDDTKDADTDEFAKRTQDKPEPQAAKGKVADPSVYDNVLDANFQPPTEQQYAEMQGLGMEIAAVAKYYGCDVDMLSTEEAQAAINAKKKALAKAEAKAAAAEVENAAKV